MNPLFDVISDKEREGERAGGIVTPYQLITCLFSVRKNYNLCTLNFKGGLFAPQI